MLFFAIKKFNSPLKISVFLPNNGVTAGVLKPDNTKIILDLMIKLYA
jgi:hypothetical protein